jgi:hypothetical protein
MSVRRRPICGLIWVLSLAPRVPGGCFKASRLGFQVRDFGGLTKRPSAFAPSLDVVPR